MIIGFPSPLQQFEVMRAVRRNQPTPYGHHLGEPLLVFQPPIHLQPGDMVWMDMRDNRVHIVKRGDIAIWRAGWQN